MFSKQKLLLAVALMFVSILELSCTPKLGEAPPDQANQQFSGTKCLVEAMPIVKKFASGDSTNEELNQFWDCANTAFEKFQKYVRGRQVSKYEATELATFIESNFFDKLPNNEKRLTPALVSEFMQIKVLFVGGSDQNLTMAELNSTISLLSEFREATLKVNPYMKLYLQTWMGSDSPVRDQKFFEAADLALQSAFRHIGDLILKNRTSYNLNRVPIFLSELAKLYREEWSLVGSVEKYLPVVKKVKKAIAGGDESVVGSEEWKRFLLLGARGYTQYLRYYYFIQNANGSAGGRRLGYLARSVEDAFSIFQDLVSEKPGGQVTKQETLEILLAFSAAYPDFKVSDKLIDEFMSLKTTLFGGSDAAWDARDFEKAKLKVPSLKAILEKIWPYYSLYAQDWDWTLYSYAEARQIFSEAEMALADSGVELGNLIEGSYDLNRALSLAQEYDRLYPPTEGKTGISQPLKKYLPILIRVKQIVFQDQDSSIRRNYWGSLLQLTSKTFFRYLDYALFVDPRPIEDPIALQSITENLVQSANLMNLIFSRISTGQISNQQVLDLFVLARDAQLIPQEFKNESLSKAINGVLTTVLVDPKKRIFEKYSPSYINSESVDVLATELKRFLKMRILLSQIFLKEDGQVANALRYSPQNLVNELKIRAMATDDVDLKLSIGEYLRVLNSPVPMVLDSAGRLLISNSSQLSFDIQSANSLALNVLLARTLVRSFAQDYSRIENYKGITQDELQVLYLIAKPLLVDLKLIDDSNVTFASSRFREANIFTPHGDGDALGSFEEIADEAAMIFSGLKLNSLLLQSLKKDCLPTLTDFPATTTVDIDCVIKSYRQSMPSALASLADYLNYMGKAPFADWKLYIFNTLKSAGYVPNPEQKVKLGDLALLPHVIQYLEMTMARFDKNNDGFLSTRDAMRAYPSFKGILLNLAENDIKKGNIKEQDLPALFTFIMRYAHPPGKIKEYLKWLLVWKNNPDSWDVWADRFQLSKILGYIADQLALAEKSTDKPALIPIDPTEIDSKALSTPPVSSSAKK